MMCFYAWLDMLMWSTIIIIIILVESTDAKLTSKVWFPKI